MTRDEIRSMLNTVPAGAERVRVAITLTGARQIRVAARAGMSPSLLSLILNGHRSCDRAQQRAIAKAIGLPVGVLFGEEVAA